MANRYGGPYTPKGGWAQGQEFRSYYAYRVARAERQGYVGGRQDDGRVIDAYRVQQEANRETRRVGQEAGIPEKRINKAISRPGKDPKGQSIRIAYTKAGWQGDQARQDQLIQDWIDEFGDIPDKEEFWYH